MIVYRISHPPSRAAPPTDGAEKSLNLIKKKKNFHNPANMLSPKTALSNFLQQIKRLPIIEIN